MSNFKFIQEDLNVKTGVEDLFVLSGGGARGKWQWEVLKILNEKGFKPAMIGGTSAGCLNAFAFAIGLIAETDQLYDEIAKNNAAQITAPGLAKLVNGQIVKNDEKIIEILKKHIGGFKLFKLLGRRSRNNLIAGLLKDFANNQSIMSNEPLLDTVKGLLKKSSHFHIPLFMNMVDMRTGQAVEVSDSDFRTPDGRMDIDNLSKAVVASTTIPAIWKLIDQFRITGDAVVREAGIKGDVRMQSNAGVFTHLADGGLRNGSPLPQMFGRIGKDPDKKYRIWVINCNREKIDELEDLNNITQIAGRTASVALNEILIGDLDMTRYRNSLAKEGITDSIYAPINIIEYSGNQGIFSFTEKSFETQRQEAQTDVDRFLAEFERKKEAGAFAVV